MGRLQAKVGTTFGRLIVRELLPLEGRRRKIRCDCSCGTRGVIRRSDALLHAGTPSCGCYEREQKSVRITARNKATATHRMSGTMTQQSWNSMIQRCFNKKQKTYQHYGALGIKVCRWLKETPAHLEELIGPCTEALPSLDRYPDQRGHYSCGKCDECIQNGWLMNLRWTTRQGQALNRKSNAYLSAFGLRLTRSQWEELSGIHEHTVRLRLRRGWTVEKALTTPDSFGNCYRPDAKAAGSGTVGGF